MCRIFVLVPLSLSLDSLFLLFVYPIYVFHVPFLFKIFSVLHSSLVVLFASWVFCSLTLFILLPMSSQQFWIHAMLVASFLKVDNSALKSSIRVSFVFGSSNWSWIIVYFLLRFQFHLYFGHNWVMILVYQLLQKFSHLWIRIKSK